MANRENFNEQNFILDYTCAPLARGEFRMYNNAMRKSTRDGRKPMAESAINTKAFRSLSYGVYIISASNGSKKAGCVVNTFQQLTSAPARVSVTINKENATTSVVLESGRFEANVLAESAPMELIGLFGFQSSNDVDKFAETTHAIDDAGVPYLNEHVVAHFGARVIETVDVGSHYLVVGEVEEAEVLSSEAPMTYAYYHQVKGGKTPPKASSYEPEEAAAGAAAAPAADTATDSAPAEAASTATAETTEAAPADAEAAPSDVRYGWRCTFCGYVEEGYDELPEGYKCPICGKGRDIFNRIELS